MAPNLVRCTVAALAITVGARTTCIGTQRAGDVASPLDVRLRTEAIESAPGDTVFVIVEVSNFGQAEAHVACGDDAVEFAVRRAGGGPVRKCANGQRRGPPDLNRRALGQYICKILAPGARAVWRVNLSCTYDLAAPGEYVLHAWAHQVVRLRTDEGTDPNFVGIVWARRPLPSNALRLVVGGPPGLGVTPEAGKPGKRDRAKRSLRKGEEM